jgi:L-ascorbate metabolism protein UlaG (beta-lactamase superfamily)
MELLMIPDRTLFRLCLLLVVASLATCATDPASAQLEVTYIANEGFFLEGGGKKILIDALLDDGIEGYVGTPASLRPALERAQPPFDSTNLILATHHHGDHFGPRAVSRHLGFNRNASFVSTPQAVEALKQVLGNVPSVLERVQAVEPTEGERLRLRENGIDLQVLNLHHGRRRSPPVQNVGYLFTIGGLKVLHVGDTEATAEDFRPYALADEKIDVAFIPSWFLSSESWLGVVRNEIQPRKIVVMHIPARDAPAGYFGEGSYDEEIQAIKEEFPEAVILTEPGDSHSLGAER